MHCFWQALLHQTKKVSDFCFVEPRNKSGTDLGGKDPVHIRIQAKSFQNLESSSSLHLLGRRQTVHSLGITNKNKQLDYFQTHRSYFHMIPA